MTTVVAVERGGDVEFAADSQVSWGSRKDPAGAEKLIRNGDVVFGFSGAVRIENLLQFVKFPPLARKVRGVDVDRWVVGEFVPAIQECFLDAKASLVSSEQQTVESNFLVAVNGRAYNIGSDFSWTRSKSGRYAIGSGSRFAMGALMAGASAVEAVKIACGLDVYSGGRVVSASWKGLVG